ncbi:DUF4476 domain-containing protein [uncultured Hymenobacter sp.]|uniref:DUF4476 domain-containing protein n=1 Tax=uncultured Hymenobacter sp. TaxID=170016 RepID=UPI0035CC0E29
MKKGLLLLLVVTLSAAGTALAGSHPLAANVNFASEHGVPFAVVLDGRPLTRGLARQVHAERLAPGLHYADFSVPTAYGGFVRLRRRVWLEPGLETTFVLRTRPGRPLDLQPAGAIALYGPYRSGRGMPGYGQGRYDERRNDRYDDRRGDGYRNGAAYPPDSYETRPNQPNSNDPGSYDPDGGPYDNAPTAERGGYYPNSTANYRLLAAPDVDGLTQALARTSFEEERLQIARQALSQSRIRAEDLARLLRALHFDSSRAELAKFAYPHVADPQNFYQVYSSFDSSLKAGEVRDALRQ